MPFERPDAMALADTPALLVAGGDARIRRDPATGLSKYGCSAHPDPALVALGSCTASTISTAGLAAADALRTALVRALSHESPEAVYASHAKRLRATLIDLCGFTDGDGVEAMLAASGTDALLLAAQWLKPDCTVMVEPDETGSGAVAALRGRHFNPRTAHRTSVTIGAPIGDWHGALHTVPVRADDGSLRPAGDIDAEWTAVVTTAALAGQRVLLILTDVSKTGLIVPAVDTMLALKRRWPAQVEVLVDACQFRMSTATVRAYLAEGCMVALTGSKFITGPTFSGVLMIPPSTAARYRNAALDTGAGAYSGIADWPQGWGASAALPATANFGLLLRWEAALPSLHAFVALPAAQITAVVRRFGATVSAALAANPCFEALPVARMERGVWAHEWDSEQTIFPFLLRTPGSQRWLTHPETEQMHQALRRADGCRERQRFQLGQPVPCGTRDGVTVSALRLCISAPMIVSACTAGEAEAEAALCSVRAAFARIGALLEGEEDASAADSISH
jgi:hypothetical protein